jgi:Zn-dependent protease
MVFYNLLLGLANLVPAYPLDAARALEGVLVRLFGRMEAVRYVCYLSAGIAAATFSVGFYLFLMRSDNFLLMALGAFFFYSAGKEARASEAAALEAISERLAKARQ